MINSYTSLSALNSSSLKSSKSTSHSSKSSTDIHSLTKDNGLRSMRILLNNLGNVRYLGLSEFHSEHSFQNSSHIWSFPKTPRFKNPRSYMNAFFYNLKPLQSNISTSFSKAKRIPLTHKMFERSPSPQAYSIKGLAEDNISKGKGTSFINKCTSDKNLHCLRSVRSPGPGEYNLMRNDLSVQNPVTIKSRNGFYYEEELKMKKHVVSMQKYSPKMSLVENGRFKGITFGIGKRSGVGIGVGGNIQGRGWNGNNRKGGIRLGPGPGTYNIPGIFDRGIKCKPVLN